MRIARVFLETALVLATCGSLAVADSIELRNGRHLQGHFIGGTSTTIGFMSGTTVEYFATSDVLALMFDNSDASGGGALQRPMSGPVSNRKTAFRQADSKKGISATKPHLSRVSAKVLE